MCFVFIETLSSRKVKLWNPDLSGLMKIVNSITRNLLTKPSKYLNYEKYSTRKRTTMYWVKLCKQHSSICLFFKLEDICLISYNWTPDTMSLRSAYMSINSIRKNFYINTTPFFHNLQVSQYHHIVLIIIAVNHLRTMQTSIFLCLRPFHKQMHCVINVHQVRWKNSVIILTPHITVSYFRILPGQWCYYMINSNALFK